MKKDIPVAGPIFEAMMQQIDRDLIADDIPIPSRPMRAISIVARRFQVSIPASGELGFVPENPQLFRELNFPLSAAINGWFRTIYGDLVNVDWSPGKMAVLLDSEIWILRFPHIMGSVQFVISRDMEVRNVETPSGVKSNILTLVQGMTQAKAALLSQEALKGLFNSFMRGYAVVDTLEATSGASELVRIARGNLRAAVDHLISPLSQYGESKWASLQVAEKAIKAAIRHAGGRYTNTHMLGSLIAQAADAGIRIANFDQIVTKIQCSPGIRYGEEPCARSDALSAHHASIDFIDLLVRAEASIFQQGIEITNGSN